MLFPSAVFLKLEHAWRIGSFKGLAGGSDPFHQMWTFHSSPPQIFVREITVGDFSHTLNGHCPVLASQKNCLKSGITGRPFEHLESAGSRLSHVIASSFLALII